MGYYDMIAISGKICSGKTTISDYLQENHGYLRVSSAYYLKLICAEMAKMNMMNKALKKELPTDRNEYKEFVTEQFHEYIDFISKSSDERNLIFQFIHLLHIEFSDVLSTSHKNDRVREMLQVVANVLINNVRETIWVQSIADHMEILKKEGHEKFVHDDMRYCFEVPVLEDCGFVTLRLEITPQEQKRRIKKVYGSIKPERLTHVSEIDLDYTPFHYMVDADSPLEEVLNYIENLVLKENTATG